MKEQYEVERVVNNNVVLARHIKKDREVVLMGKGLGFGKKRGQRMDASTGVEKSFEAGSATRKDSYLRMLEEVNGDVVDICTEILLIAEERLGNLSDKSFIVVVDHISFAIEKLGKAIEIENPFVSEIEQLYPEEYAIGAYARKLIEERLGVDITEDEVGFIALHLNAAREHRVVKDTLKDTRIIKSMVNIIESELGLDLRDWPVLHQRLLAHLRGLVKHMDGGRFEPRHPLYEITMKECHESHGIVQKLAALLAGEGKIMQDSNIFYLTLHIDRLLRLQRKV